jgi:biopolymer transport protein ExbD
MQLTTGFEKRRPRIEIVPLIDVVFLLLVFFIYAMLSMTVYRGLRVALPRGVGEVQDKQALVITIAADASLWVQKEPVDIPAAVRRAAEHARERRGPVLISGDRRADLGTAIELLAALRRAEVDQVSFQVEEAP